MRVVEARLGGLTEALFVLDLLAQRLGDGGLEGRRRGVEEVGRGGSCAGGSRPTWQRRVLLALGWEARGRGDGERGGATAAAGEEGAEGT